MSRILLATMWLGTGVAGVAGATELVRLAPGQPPAVLELEPFRLFRPGARMTVHGAAGARAEPLPATDYLRGRVRGEPGSLAVLAVEPDGRRRGLVVRGGRSYEVAGDARGLETLAERPVESRPSGDRCAAGSAPAPVVAPPAFALAPPRGDGIQAAIVAVETDWELFERLGSSAAVASHVGDLFATVAAVYRRDLGTDVELGELIVWETAFDPFTVESGFLDALYELGDHWHAEHAAVERATVHFVSGKGGILGGIAYHGVLCTPDSPVAGGQHWGGGYSLTGSHGVFGAFRDAYLTAHELGHNFRSHHSHCYNDLPLPGDPEVDRCYSGDVRNDGHPCYAGAVSVPGDGGSIMSYCHLLSGGYSNVVLSLGGPGVHGERSERIVDRMRAHVESVGCLVDADPTLFVDGFETGDVDRWSAAFP